MCWSPRNSPPPSVLAWYLFALGNCVEFAVVLQFMAWMQWSLGDLIAASFVVWTFMYALAGCYHGLVHDTPRQESMRDPLLARSEAASGAVEEEKYCGLHSHLVCLSWPCFFCIVCCPVDTKSTDEETSAQCISHNFRTEPSPLTLATCAGTVETTLSAFSGVSGLSWCASRSTCAKEAVVKRPQARPLLTRGWGVVATLQNHSPWVRSDHSWAKGLN